MLPGSHLASEDLLLVQPSDICLVVQETGPFWWWCHSIGTCAHRNIPDSIPDCF